MPSHYSSANYFHRIFQGVQEVLADEEFALLVVSPRADQQSIEKQGLPEIFARGGIDGVLDLGFWFQEKRDLLFTTPQLAELPAVVMLWASPRCGVVQVDYEAGAYTARAPFACAGPSPVAAIPVLSPHGAGARPHRRHPARAGGIRVGSRAAPAFSPPLRSLAGDGLANTPSPVHPRIRGYRPPAGAARAAARAQPEITGILAWNDNVAREIRYTLAEAGIQVPEEISLIGFDDTDAMPDELGRNQLTSVHIPLYDIGAQAARLLLRQIAQPRETPWETITMPTELMVRGSTAACPRM